MNQTRILWRMVAALLLAIWTGGCAVAPPPPVIVSVPQMTQALASRTLGTWRLGDLADLQVKDVSVTLLPATQRLAIAYDLSIQETVLRSRWPASAKVELGLRYEPASQSFVVVDPQLKQLDVKSLPVAWGVTVQALLSQQVTRRLEGLAVYRLKSQDIELMARHQVQPSALKIEVDGLQILWGPRNNPG